MLADGFATGVEFPQLADFASNGINRLFNAVLKKPVRGNRCVASTEVLFQQIGNDPNAWFEKELEKRLADPQFASAQLQRIQAGVRQQPQNNTIKLPPSIGKVPSSQSASDDGGDLSDGSLFAHAMR